jgi:alcohol dehydrogenase
MRQLTYVGGNTIEWWDVPAPKLLDDRDALVRPLAVTRCDLDLTIVNGKSGLPGPFALGHETAGIITEVGDAVRTFAPGDLVIVPFQISCGQCQRCQRGHTNACTTVPFRSSYGLKPVCGVEYGGALSDLFACHSPTICWSGSPKATHCRRRRGLPMAPPTPLAPSPTGCGNGLAPKFW